MVLHFHNNDIELLIRQDYHISRCTRRRLKACVRASVPGPVDYARHKQTTLYGDLANIYRGPWRIEPLMEDRPASHIRWFNSARNIPGLRRHIGQLCSTRNLCGGGAESCVLSLTESGGGETNAKCSACSERGHWLGVGERGEVCLGLGALAISALLLELLYNRSGGSPLKGFVLDCVVTTAGGGRDGGGGA